MRNLKRALSLGLTAAMISGLMVMGSSAASYADVTSEDNVEAIEVLQTVGIMVGDENGDFNPDQNVTRNEMAVIMSNLMEYNVATYKDTSPFTDVPSWAEPYVAACWTNGITAGTSATTYGGSDTVTTAQAALMLMKALGYFQYSSDFGADWQLATVRQGNAIDLFNGVDSGVTAPMTRNDVAKLVLNTLEAGTVTASTEGSWSIGNVTIASGVQYNYITSNASYASAIDSDRQTNNDGDLVSGYIVELGEQLYQGDLRLREGTSDDFGRPSRTWYYENSEIGTYAETPDLTYTTSVESGEIYSDLGLGQSVISSDVTVYVDGEEVDNSVAIRRSSETKLPNSGNGVLTEVFYDEDDDTALITHVNTYVGTIVRSVEADGNEAAYVIVAPEAAINGEAAPISGGEKFETEESFEDDAYVLYTYSEAADEIMSVELAEEVNGVVTRAENDDTNEEDAKALTIDGTRYTDSKYVAGEELGDISVDEEYTVYLDSYGYLIYVERIDEIGDYALLYNVSSGDWNTANQAYLIFADGTEARVDTAEDYSDPENLNVRKSTDGKVDTTWNSDGTWDSNEPVIVTYRVDENNVYTLRAVATEQDTNPASWNVTEKDYDSTGFDMVNDRAGITIDTGNVVRANSATTFVVRDPDDNDGSDAVSIKPDWTAYTGIKNAPTIQTDTTPAENDVNVYWYCKNSNMTTIMFIVPDSATVVDDGNNDGLYLSAESVSNLIHDADGDYFIYQAAEDGAVVDEVRVAEFVTVVDKTGTTHTNVNGKTVGDHIYDRYSVNKDGIITRLVMHTDLNIADGAGYGEYTGIARTSEEYTVILGTSLDKDDDPATHSETITVDEDANIFYVEDNGDITVSSYNAIAIDDDDVILAVVDDYMVQNLVIIEFDRTNDAGGSVSVSGGKTVQVGDDGVVLTATPTGNDTKRDEAVSYQWYRNTVDSITVNDETGAVTGGATRIPGATSDTYTVPTDDVSNYYYFCVVEFYNDRVNGRDTYYAVNAAGAQVIVTAASMDVFVTYVDVKDGTTEVGTQLVNGVQAETDKSYALLNKSPNKELLTIPDDYDFASANQPVEFDANGYATATVLVKQVRFDVTFELDNSTLSNATYTLSIVGDDDNIVRMGAGDSVVLHVVGSSGWTDAYVGTVNDTTNFTASEYTPDEGGTGFTFKVTLNGNLTADKSVEVGYTSAS